MKSIAVLISDGSEEIEALTPVDVLRRAGVNVKLISVCNEKITGSHKIAITADGVIDKEDLSIYDGIVIPGGMPGAKIISENAIAVNAISNAVKSGKLVAAICAAPAVVLAAHGLIKNKKVTCYPASAFIEEIEKTATYTGNNTEKDCNVITANGPKSAMEFSFEICKFLGVEPKF